MYAYTRKSDNVLSFYSEGKIGIDTRLFNELYVVWNDSDIVRMRDTLSRGGFIRVTERGEMRFILPESELIKMNLKGRLENCQNIDHIKSVILDLIK